jgi:hypothetical protein
MMPTCSLQALREDKLEGPHTLERLLPAGSFALPLRTTVKACTGDTAVHDWHRLREIKDLADILVLLAADDLDEQLLRPLDFLVRHGFAAATCRVQNGSQDSALHVRVYLIPSDIVSVAGRLQGGRENGRKYLHDLLVRLARDASSWNAETASYEFKQSSFVFDNQVVRLVLVPRFSAADHGAHNSSGQFAARRDLQRFVASLYL